MTTQAVQVQDAGMPKGKAAKPEPTEQIAIRMPRSLLDRVKAYTERLREQTGLDLKDAGTVRRLIELGLDAVESDEKPARKK